MACRGSPRRRARPRARRLPCTCRGCFHLFFWTSCIKSIKYKVNPPPGVGAGSKGRSRKLPRRRHELSAFRRRHTMLSVLCLLASASGLVLTVSSRTSTISMGLAVGEQMPASVLRKAGVANKKAVLFFCERTFLIPSKTLMKYHPLTRHTNPMLPVRWC